MVIDRLLHRLDLGRLGPRRRRTRREAAAIRGLPDRRMMAETFTPAFAARGGRILWVGARAYTVEDYPALERLGAEVWTTDIDPKATRWGRDGRHRTGDVRAIDQVFPDLRFDTVVCNGVLGFGVDAPDHQAQALDAIANVLTDGGWLLLGWNTDRIDDPVAAGLTHPRFRRAEFAGAPSRTAFDDVTHVYDSLAKA